jgi:hypothetical protein
MKNIGFSIEKGEKTTDAAARFAKIILEMTNTQLVVVHCEAIN